VGWVRAPAQAVWAVWRCCISSTIGIAGVGNDFHLNTPPVAVLTTAEWQLTDPARLPAVLGSRASRASRGTPGPRAEDARDRACGSRRDRTTANSRPTSRCSVATDGPRELRSRAPPLNAYPLAGPRCGAVREEAVCAPGLQRACCGSNRSSIVVDLSSSRARRELDAQAGAEDRRGVARPIQALRFP